jgi:hypothetical protein
MWRASRSRGTHTANPLATAQTPGENVVETQAPRAVFTLDLLIY